MIKLGNQFTIEEFKAVVHENKRVQITSTQKQTIQVAREFLEEQIKKERTMYGINTGFGKLANVRIESSLLEELQVNLVKSHSASIGNPLSKEHVRGAMVLLANSLARGYSGVRPVIVEKIIELLNNQVTPIVYEHGSLGASGDLAPLAHVALALIGEGPVLYEDKRYDTIKAVGIEPVALKEKEGLALINGTHFSTAALALAVLKSIENLKHAIIISALSIEGLQGTNMSFHPAVHRIRPYQGQLQISAKLWGLLKGSKILESHHDPVRDPRVQDPYSIRCTPQVLGAIEETLQFVKKIVEIEMNSVTDNPLIFPELGEVISGGNFHGEPIALAADYLSIGLTEIATISEKRTEKLLNSAYNNGLPAFLTPKPGVNSGYMIAHYTQASLINKLATLCTPSTVTKVSVSAHQEDHVSMSMNAAMKALQVAELVEEVLAIELLVAIQAIHFHYQKGLTTSPVLNKVVKTIREEIDPLEKDRVIHKDIQQAQKILKTKRLINLVETSLKQRLIHLE